MSTETLRQAATILRKRANAASPAPWRTFAHHGRDMTDEGWSELGVENDGHTVAITYPTGFENDYPEPDAAFIATMDPDMARMLADWLDHEARWDDMQGQTVGANHPSMVLARKIIEGA